MDTNDFHVTAVDPLTKKMLWGRYTNDPDVAKDIVDLIQAEGNVAILFQWDPTQDTFKVIQCEELCAPSGPLERLRKMCKGYGVKVHYVDPIKGTIRGEVRNAFFDIILVGERIQFDIEPTPMVDALDCHTKILDLTRFLRNLG